MHELPADSPVSASCLPVGMLRSWMHATASSFLLGFRALNLSGTCDDSFPTAELSSGPKLGCLSEEGERSELHGRAKKIPPLSTARGCGKQVTIEKVQKKAMLSESRREKGGPADMKLSHPLLHVNPSHYALKTKACGPAT